MVGNSLKPKFRVDLVVAGRSHLYDVVRGDRKKRLPGVTGVLSVIAKPALIPWAKKEALASVETAIMKRLDGRASAAVEIDREWIGQVLQEAKKRPDKIKDQAAAFGTHAHALIDRIILGDEPAEIPPEVAGPVHAFKDWWRSSGIELVMGDTKVASPEYGYGGSLDALGRRNGRYVILDWKTSNGIYTEYALQVAAYAQAFRETYGVPCSEAIIVRFGKKLPIEFEYKELADLDLSLSAFLAAKSLKEALEQPHFQTW